MNKAFAAALGGLALTACASMPPVTVQYYPTAGTMEVTVLETLTCTPDKSQIVAVYALRPETRYFRRAGVQPHRIALQGIIPPWGDGSTGFAFYEDGRLKSLNATATGRGEEIVSATVDILAAAATAGLKADPGNPCNSIAGADGKGVVTMEHFVPRNYRRDSDGAVTLVMDSRRGDLQDALPRLSVKIGDPRRITPVSYEAPDSRDVVALHLNHTESIEVSLEITQGPGASRTITRTAILPQPDTYVVPIPRAALFGERSVSLALAESGAVTELSYGTKSGAAGAGNAATSVLGQFAEDSAAARAAEIKAEADLIVQQQRLARCRADPASCS